MREVFGFQKLRSGQAPLQKLRAAFGLSDPLPIQYVKWIANLLRGLDGNVLPHYKAYASWRGMDIGDDASIGADIPRHDRHGIEGPLLDRAERV